MTYGEMKDLVLQLLHRYSVAGETVPLTYNDQADAVIRIPALTRDALYYITTSVRRLRTVAELAEPEELGGWLCYDLPEDCYQLAAGTDRTLFFRSHWAKDIAAMSGCSGNMRCCTSAMVSMPEFPARK